MNTNNKHFQNGKYVVPPNYQHLSQNSYNNSKKLILNKKYGNNYFRYSETQHNSYYNAATRYANAISSNQTINSYYNTYNNLVNISANDLSFTAMKSSLKSRYLQQNYYNDIFNTEFNQKLASSYQKYKYLNSQNGDFNLTSKKNQLFQHNFNNQSDIEQIPVTHYPTYLAKDLKNIKNENQIESDNILKSSEIFLKNKNVLTNNVNKKCENDLSINNETQNNLIQINLIDNEISDQEKCIVKNEKQAKAISYPILPNEILWEVVQFLSFNDCAKIALVSRVFTHLTEPRTKLKLKLLIEQIDRTQKQLRVTNNQISERQEQISVLNNQIGVMNNRLSEMNNRLLSMNSQIIQSHQRIDELLTRLRLLQQPRCQKDSNNNKENLNNKK